MLLSNQENEHISAPETKLTRLKLKENKLCSVFIILHQGMRYSQYKKSPNSVGDFPDVLEALTITIPVSLVI